MDMVIYNQQWQQESVIKTPALTITYMKLIVRHDSNMESQRSGSLVPLE